ncbi:MAG TPA: MarR family transcriptional regulator [Candidatus Paceibacterota bacterium]|nr:MarR family transcriptional regulator [Candidatus Paceibacterota bacterium]
MKNKNVGLLIIGISVIIGIIIYLFNSGLTNVVISSCSHGSSCGMYDTIKIQTYVSIFLVIIIIIIGLVIMFTKEEKEIITKIKTLKTKEPETKKQSIDILDLNSDEKNILKIINESEGTIFQSEIVEKSKLNKVKVTRILDRLEGKQIIERKRRGMTNIVILKNR